jgi:hypothetical protein
MMRQDREEGGTHFLAVLGFAFFKGAWAMVCVLPDAWYGLLID